MRHLQHWPLVDEAAVMMVAALAFDYWAEQTSPAPDPMMRTLTRARLMEAVEGLHVEDRIVLARMAASRAREGRLADAAVTR